MTQAAKFLSPLRVILDDDLAHAGQGAWVLLSPLEYESTGGQVYTVPAGFRTDFASVPRVPMAYWLAGSTAHRPAVLHDFLVGSPLVSRRQADDIFLEAMLSLGMPRWRARLMHLAVRSYTAALFGGD